MKHIDRLVIRELIGPWLFGVAMFATLLMAATYLNRIADYIVQGLPLGLITKITLLLLPAMLAKTFAMAVLLAALLGFGRLSSDSEVTALRAAGASMPRIVWPVAVFSLVIAVVTFVFNDRVVPPAAAESQALVNDIANHAQGVAGQPISIPIVENGKFKGQMMAQAFDVLGRTLNNVTVVAYDSKQQPSFFMFCNKLEYRGAKVWHVRGGGYLIPADGGQKITFDEAYPDEIPKISATPQDLLTIDEKDNDVYSMAEIQAQIERGKRDKSLSSFRRHNLEYGYWNKISVALAAFIFGTLGAVLGIRSQRTSAASGFAMAIAIIFGYFTLTNFMNVWAQNGVMPAWMASFSPIAIGIVATGVIMWRRNS